MWGDIPGYEGFYQVTESGEVRSISHIRKNGKSSSYLQRGKILKQRLNKKGYYVVRLSKHGVVKDKLVHCLVAATFLPNPDNLPIINHKDECKTNNNLDNLEWCTRRYNQIYSLGKQVINLSTGKIYGSLSEVEKDGYCWRQVSGCCRGITKTHKGEEWGYYDNYKFTEQMYLKGM